MTTNCSLPVCIGKFSANYVPCITDAPPGYDGHGTIQLFDYDYPLDGVTRRNARLVLIRQDALEWHIGRYGSGLHACCVGEAALDALGVTLDQLASELLNRLISGAEKKS